MTKPLTREEIISAEPLSKPPAPLADLGARPKTNNNLRIKLLAGAGASFALLTAAFGVYQYAFAAKTISTDNAYVAADAAQVTALISAPVSEIHVIDTQRVKAGDVLATLDATDRKLELEQAQAALEQAERKVRGYSANDGALGGQVAARRADLVRAQAELEQARSDLARAEKLAGPGAISLEQLNASRTAFATSQAAVGQAQANLRAAQGSQEANAVLISGAKLDQNPEVAEARAHMDQARVNLERTVIRAPIDGVVAKRNVQVGQMVQPGAAIMAIVPTQQAYVNANFKEVQLRGVRPGQPVELESDLYGGNIKYHGKIVGPSAGTGSAFAVIPAQNATGNWIKVVQRLPVRIALDPAELADNPLQVGLSMKAVVRLDR